MSTRETLHRAAHALAGFLRGFLGLPGAPGTPASGAPSDAAAARQALTERAAQRRSCC